MCLLRTYGNSPLCSTGHRPFGAAALLSLHFFTGSLPAGHQVPLTMSDPWMTSFFLFSFSSFFLSLFIRVHATLQPALSVRWSVGWLVSRSVGQSVTFYFFYDFYFWTSLLLPKWSSDFKYGPCPPARDFGSRVLAFFFPVNAT